MKLVCGNCRQVLRRSPGRRLPGEPELGWDEAGPFIRCPACGNLERNIAIPPTEAAESGEPR